MNFLPNSAKQPQVRVKLHLHARNRRPRESVILPQIDRPLRAMQAEHRLTSITDDMHMRGTMIVEIDHSPEPVESQDSRHFTLKG